MAKTKKYPLDSLTISQKDKLLDSFYSNNPTSESIQYMNGLRTGRIKPHKLK